MWEEIPRIFYCHFAGTEPEDKLSGGFYDESYIRPGAGMKFDEYFAVTYLLCGTTRLTDYLGREWRAEPGSLLIRHAGTRFQTEHAFDRGRWLEFSAALPAEFYRLLRRGGVVTPELTLVTPGLSGVLVETALRYVEALAEADTAAGRARALGIFLEFFGAALKAAAAPAATAEADAQFLRRACALLDAVPERELPVRQAAAKLGIGYELFRKKFTALCGMPPHEYRLRRRFACAEALLLHSNLSVKEIAARAGYESSAAFIRQYRSRYGVSPGALRRH